MPITGSVTVFPCPHCGKPTILNPELENHCRLCGAEIGIDREGRAYVKSPPSDPQHDPDPNESSARIVGESTSEPDTLPADVEAAWAEWSKGIKNVDERGWELLRAAFEAGVEAGSIKR